MNCGRFREIFGARVDCATAEGDEAGLHMDNCKECSTWFDSLDHSGFDRFLEHNPPAAQGFYMALAERTFPQAILTRGRPHRIGRI